MSARVGCLSISVAVAGLAAVVFGLAGRDQWYEPDPLVPLAVADGTRAFNDEVRVIQEARFVASEPVAGGATTAIATTLGYTQWRQRFTIHAEECVALVVGVTSGYALPSFGALFPSEFTALDDVVRERSSPSAGVGNHPQSLSQSTGAGATVTLNWCEHQEKTVDAVVVFRSVDGAHSPRRADAVLQTQLFRGPWALIGGPLSLPRPGPNPLALRRLAAESADPLGQAERELMEGLVMIEPPRTIQMGFASLFPVDSNTLSTLYHMAARDSGVAVHPRVLLSTPEEMATGLATFMQLAGAASFPAEHDPIVDLGRNDFYRVLAVLGPNSTTDECQMLNFARGEGLFIPRVYRYNPISRTKQVLTSPHTNNVVRDRLCTNEGTVSYIVNDTDQMTYRLVRMAQHGAVVPTVASGPRPTRR